MHDLGQTFSGSYELHDVLGRHTVATVHRATMLPRGRGTRGQRVVALLISEPLTSPSGRRLARVIERRATAAMDISHPGVARVLDAGAVDDRVYVATAWRESITLDDLLSRRWRLPPEETIALLRLLAEGLDAAHDAGIVHGALGVRTIRVDTGDADGHRSAFLTAFGMDALLTHRFAAKRQREPSPILDEMLYTAPEQLRGGMATAATDQYALACAIYHCVAGQPPFVRETASALFGAHLFARPDGNDTFDATSNPALREALATGMAKQPEDRHGSCVRLIAVAGGGSTTVTARSTGDADGRYAAAGAGLVTAQPTIDSGTDVHRHASGVGTGRTRLVELRRRLPARVVPLLALAAGVIVALLVVVAPTDDDPAATAVLDGAAAKADADAEVGDTAARDDEQPQPQPAAVSWSLAAADTPVVAVTAIDDALLAVAEDEIVALDAETARPRWRQAVDDGTATGSVVTDGALVYRSSRLEAIDLDDGEQRWVRDDPFTPTGALAAVPGGLLYGTVPGQFSPAIVAIDPATGQEEWHFHGDAVNIDRRAASAVADDFVAILQRGTLLAIDPNAEQGGTGANRSEIREGRWTADVARPWVSSVTLTDDAVLLGTRAGRVCSYARDDGERRWCRPVAGADDGRPTLRADDELIVVATPTAVVALEPSTGAAEWDAPSDRRIFAMERTDGAIVVGDGAGTVRALDPASGQLMWQIAGLARVTALSVTTDAVYVGAQDGSVARLQPEDGSGRP